MLSHRFSGRLSGLLRPALGASNTRQSVFHRRRVYGDVAGLVLEVRDTLDCPYEAAGFPRGILLFETTGNSEEQVVDDLIAWQNQTSCGIEEANYEVLYAPGATYRCRLYRIWNVSDCNPDGTFTEVWDTLGEPFEGHGELPSGELLAAEEDFSRIAIRRRVNAWRQQHNIAVAGSWGRGIAP